MTAKTVVFKKIMKKAKCVESRRCLTRKCTLEGDVWTLYMDENLLNLVKRSHVNEVLRVNPKKCWLRAM